MDNCIDLLVPFKKLEHLLTALRILNKYPNYHVSTLTELIIKTTDYHVTIRQITELQSRMNAYPETYGTRFFISDDSGGSLCKKLDQLTAVQFVTTENSCIFCGSDLNQINKRKSKAICYYYALGPKEVSIDILECISCGASHYLNYADIGGKSRKFYENTLNEKFLAFTDESVFERLLLDSFTADLLSKHSSFKGFANSYNILFELKAQYKNGKSFDRICLNEIRINQAWFYLQYLRVSSEICQKLPYPSPLMQDLTLSIGINLKPFLSKYFIEKWTGKVR